MSKLYTLFRQKRNGKNEHDTKDGKLHIFEVYEENGEYYAKRNSLCGDIILNTTINIKPNNIFTEPQIKVKQFSLESAKNKSYVLPTDTCKKCRGICE